MNVLEGLYGSKSPPKEGNKGKKQTKKKRRKPAGKPKGKQQGKPGGKPKGKAHKKMNNRQLAEIYLRNKEELMQKYYNDRNRRFLDIDRARVYEDKTYTRKQLLDKVTADLNRRDEERKMLDANLVHFFDKKAHFKLVDEYERKLRIERDNLFVNQRMFEWFKAHPGQRFYKENIPEVFGVEHAGAIKLLNDTVPDEGVLGWTLEQIKRTKDIEAGFDPVDSGSQEIYYYVPVFEDKDLQNPGAPPRYTLAPLFMPPVHSIEVVKPPTAAGVTPEFGAGGVTPPMGGATPTGATPEFGAGGVTPPMGGATPTGGTPEFGAGGVTPPMGGATPTGATPEFGAGGVTPPMGGATPEFGAGGVTPPMGGATPPMVDVSPKQLVASGTPVVKVDTRPQDEQMAAQLPSKQKSKTKTQKAKPPCKPGKVRHPETGRCVNPDGPAMKAYRKKVGSAAGKTKTQKAKPPCKAGKVRHPETGRCVNPDGPAMKAYRKKVAAKAEK
jgi:hypothetical protein